MMGLPARLVSWSRHQLHCGQQRIFFFRVRGAGGAQDVCAIFKPPWPIYPAVSLLWSSRGGNSSGQVRCSSSSVWSKSSSSANASGEAKPIEELWEEYFADPLQWWDNRIDKRNSRSPDFKHKVTKSALWVDGWSTPAWVNTRLKSVIEGKLQSHAVCCTNASQDTAQPNRLPEGNRGKRKTLPTSARDLRQFVQGGDGSKGNQSTSTIAMLKNLLQQGITIDSYMYVEVLQQCLKQKDLVAAKQVHDCIIKSGMEQNMYVANNLLSVYIRCGRLQDARRVFDALLKKNVFSWTIMIGGYSQHNHPKNAMEVLNQMHQEGVQPNEVTYLSILKACASPAALNWGKEVHANIRYAGLESDVRVGTALLSMYAKCGCIKEARQAFDNLTNHDVFSWNAMIGAYAEGGCGVEAYKLFLQMQREGFKPDAITYMSILNASASTGALDWVKEVHKHVLEAGLESDLRLGNALVHMYAKSGSIDDARLVFDRMEERDIITWSVMIGGLAEHGRGHEALDVFRKMNAEGIKPDGLSFVALLSACSHAGLVDEGRQLFLAMTDEFGVEPTVVHCNCMVDLFGRAGHLEEAKLFIGNMPVEPDGTTWGALLGACRTYGNVELGELAAKELLKLEPQGASPYVLLSNIYAAAGKWEEVSLVRTMMQERGIRKEPGRSWIEVNNKIHDFVVGDKSHPEGKEIYAELNR